MVIFHMFKYERVASIKILQGYHRCYMTGGFAYVSPRSSVRHHAAMTMPIGDIRWSWLHGIANDCPFDFEEATVNCEWRRLCVVFCCMILQILHVFCSKYENFSIFLRCCSFNRLIHAKQQRARCPSYCSYHLVIKHA